MAKNTGIPYERLTLAVFDQLLKQDNVKTLKLDHDVQLPSMRTPLVSHQIDVYWEFEAGGVVHRTVVQAKDWGSAVPQGEILKFKGVLDDIAGQPRGVFVTRTGYQSGAYELAKANGIALFELREPVDSDWDGYIKTIEIELHAYVPRATDEGVEIDEEWLKAEAKRQGVPEGQPFSFRIEGLSNELALLDGNGVKIETMYDVIQRLIIRDTEGFTEYAPERRRWEFEQDTFIASGNPVIPMLKLVAISATTSMSMFTRKIVVDGGDIVGLILKNVIDGTRHSFDKQGKLRSDQQGEDTPI